MITPVTWHQVATQAVGIFTIAWVLTAVFSTAFQCPSPRQWDILDKRCIDIVSDQYPAFETLLMHIVEEC